ncbi:methyltransferase domain-containing protein [uncultured Tateyamaria sp.]|uniref:methyltransferase domain-containing protein n=1 Tax=uncultured Tateyamaria sp. TaxID=455651 RepID=UPI00261A0C1D|nr:methyltransferase domain-containing protein [uncultured Tateyamaria sp.]
MTLVRDSLLASVTKDMLGLEVAPWFNPIAPRKAGFNVRTLDVFDDQQLMARAKSDPTVLPETYDRLEAVDYVGSATEIASLVDASDHGAFDYVVSSHNFEHLPNPIKFLQGCEALLKPGGQLIMVLPDGRSCFDYFRAHTDISEWLEAYLEDRVQPNGRQVFAFYASIATTEHAGISGPTAVSETTPTNAIKIEREISKQWDDWCAGKAEAAYVDTHCSVFTPSSFHLLIAECRALGLTAFEVAEVGETHGVEFCVRLVRSETRPIPDAAASCRSIRTGLLRQVWDEHAVRYSAVGTQSVKDALRARVDLQRGGIVQLLRRWNRKRLQKRCDRQG